MDSHLRLIRKAKKMTLENVQTALSGIGRDSTIANLSMVERGLIWPSRDVVDSLVEIFPGEITEVQILYPFRGVSHD